MPNPEEIVEWEEAARQNDIVLYNVDVTDKEEFRELCELLSVQGVAAKSRLRTYVGSARKKQRPVRYIKGVDPDDPSTLPRQHLVDLVLSSVERSEFVLLKGPAAVGKTSVMNITEYYCRTHSSSEGSLPATGFTYIERDGKPTMEQLDDALEKMANWQDGDPPRILFCDDIHNAPSRFWESLISTDFFKTRHVRIVAAATRRCASDPASPVLSSDSVISYPSLRLSHEEVGTFLPSFMEMKSNLLKLEGHGLDMVVNAVVDQCDGHIFALMASLDKLDDFAQIPANQNSGKIISYLLSKPFLKHTYERIWPPNADDFPNKYRRLLQDAMMDEKVSVPVEVQILLMKMYFLQDVNQTMTDSTWPKLKQEITFKLAARRLYSYLFDSRGDEDYRPQSIVELVASALEKFKRVDLVQAKSATAVGFPKEGALQQMFFGAITSVLPASTEVVSEMSAILPDRGDKKKGELDFYVNSDFYYGIELMRDGGSFSEHKERFEAPVASNLNKGKYFTPLIKSYIIVDFRQSGFRAKDKDAFRLVVEFSEDYDACDLWLAGTKIQEITFV